MAPRSPPPSSARRGLRWWLTQREAAAVIFMVALWLFGFWLRPDFWGGLDNSFNLILAFTEIGLMAVGMSYVMANGDVDLSVGAVLALSGSTAAFLMKFMGWAPLPAGLGGFAAGLLAGCVNGLLATRLLLPAFVATLGMFYVARGHRRLAGGRAAAQPVPRELQPDRPQADRDPASVLGIEPAPGGLWFDVASALSTQSILLVRPGRSWPGSCSPRPPSATWCSRPAATGARPNMPASTPARCGSGASSSARPAPRWPG